MPSHKDFIKPACSACSLELQHACISLKKCVLLCQWKAMLKLSAEDWISGSTEQFSFQLLLHRELIRAEELEQSKPHRFQEGGWLSPWSCPQLTAHKLLRELCLLLMRSLLSALLCALSENAGHSFAPLVQLSGSEQEGAQLFSNCVCRSALIQVWCRMIFSSQMNLLQWQLSFSFPPPCLYLQSFHQEKQIHSRLPGQELGIRNKPPMET